MVSETKMAKPGDTSRTRNAMLIEYEDMLLWTHPKKKNIQDWASRKLPLNVGRLFLATF
jgi:hypothetical protein